MISYYTCPNSPTVWIGLTFIIKEVMVCIAEISQMDEAK